MKSRIEISAPLIIIAVLLTTVAQADYEYDYLSDLISREHRDASDVDDWIERGNATVTASPRFEDGVRLTAWASEYDEDEEHEFAIGSAVYFFEIPRHAQFIEILVRYRGEPHEAELEDQEEITGRVWIRNTKREYARRRYDDEHADETRYGDTFFLRAKRRSETIKIAAAGHIDDGLLEMHIVVEDGEQLDVEHVDVLTYRRQHPPRVVQYYTRNYDWRPWHRYTYRYFYDGPSYYCTDLNFYYRWSYPIYDHHYLSIRYAYGDYLHRYYSRHPQYYYRSYSNYVNVHAHADTSVETRTRKLGRWTGTHETVRREYTRSRLSRSAGSAKKSSSDVRASVRTIIEKRGQKSASADRVQRLAVSRKRKSFNAETEFSSTIRRRSQYLRSSPTPFDQGKRSSASQLSQKRKRYSSSSKYKSQRTYTRSNDERRQRLYTGSRVSPSPSSIPSSRSKSSSVRTSPTKQKRVESSSSTSRRKISTSSSRPARSSPKASSSKKDDDDEKKNEARQSERARNIERTKQKRRK